VVRLPTPRTRKRRWWTVDDARQFLESTRRAKEPLYAAFVLILVLGLRKGEVLGLTWELVNLDAAELYVGEQVQRVGNELLRRQVKTETSEAPLPLPELCVAALKLRHDQQEADRNRAAGGWMDTGLVFTTRHGTAVEPRNFSRSFDRCIVKSQVPRITVHGTRKTCGALLAALDVHSRVAMRFCGTARSPSRWRSTPRFPRPPPAPRCTSSASGSATRRCCTSVLYGNKNGRFPQKEPASDLGGRYWDRTSDLLGVNEALSR
jgi:integrase